MLSVSYIGQHRSEKTPPPETLLLHTRPRSHGSLLTSQANSAAAAVLRDIMLGSGQTAAVAVFSVMSLQLLFVALFKPTGIDTAHRGQRRVRISRFRGPVVGFKFAAVVVA